MGQHILLLSNKLDLKRQPHEKKAPCWKLSRGSLISLCAGVWLDPAGKNLRSSRHVGAHGRESMGFCGLWSRDSGLCGGAGSCVTPTENEVVVDSHWNDAH